MSRAVMVLLHGDLGRRRGHRRRADKRRPRQHERDGNQKAGYSVDEPHVRNLRP